MPRFFLPYFDVLYKMKVLILSVGIFLHFSILASAENVQVQYGNNSEPIKIFDQSESNEQKLIVDEETKRSEMNAPAADKKEYIFFCDLNGISFIIDSATYKVINSYYLPEVAFALIAVVGDTFYKIHTRNGSIYSTAVKNLLQGQKGIIWEHAGSFPSEENYIVRGSNTADGSLIYFVTYTGNLYLYDTVSRLVTKKGIAPGDSSYASLVRINNVLYIYKHKFFYSLKGDEIKLIKTPDTRVGAGLFRVENYLCIVGGNSTETYPDPVHYHNLENGEWSTFRQINEARRFPGIAATESKAYIFGGLADFYSPNMTDFWRNSIEVMDHKAENWHFNFAPTPLTGNHEYIEAVVFYG